VNTAPPPHVPVDDDDALRAALREHGGVLLRQALPIDDVNALADAVRPQLLQRGWVDAHLRARADTPGYDDDDFVSLQQWAFTAPEFVGLRRTAPLQRWMRVALDTDVGERLGDLVRVKCNCGDRETLPHQDGHYVRGEDALYTVWAPLLPTPMSRGPLAISPGSHRRGLLPHVGEGVGHQGVAVDDDLLWWVCGLQPGDVWIFHQHTLHRALPNTDDVVRLSVDYRFVAAAALSTSR